MNITFSLGLHAAIGMIIAKTNTIESALFIAFILPWRSSINDSSPSYECMITTLLEACVKVLWSFCGERWLPLLFVTSTYMSADDILC